MLLIPTPRSLNYKNGSFFIRPNTRIILDASWDLSDLNSAVLLQQEIEKLHFTRLKITKAIHNDKQDYIFLKKETTEHEAYKILVDESGIQITAGDSQGLFYSIQTMRQIIRNSGMIIPCMEIEDSPYFKNRGFYHDVTRGKVPKLDTLKELADRAAFYKINQLQLYVEHSFAFKNHSEVWTGLDPLTAEEILIFDEYCAKRHIELVPSLSTFGHLYQALSSHSFSHLCELDGSTGKPFTWVDRNSHHTLDVSNPQSFLFIKEMLDEFIPLFSSKKFNIGCDETYDLGRGKNKELAQKVGKGKLYVDFLTKIINHVKSHSKEVLFWGDIMLKHHEIIDELPKDLVCLNWYYYQGGLPQKEIDAKTLENSGMKQYMCPGVSSWHSLMSNLDTSSVNIKRMIEIGMKSNVEGILNTDWGGYGHINFMGISIPGMIYGADLSWNPNVSDDFESYDQKISFIEYGATKMELVGILRELSRQQTIHWQDICMWNYNRIYNMNINIQKRVTDTDYESIRVGYENSLKLADKILTISANISREKQLDLKEFYVSAQGIALFDSLHLIIKKYYDVKNEDKLIDEPNELAVQLEYWFSDFCDLWRQRNKESELFRIKEVLISICGYLRTL